MDLDSGVVSLSQSNQKRKKGLFSRFVSKINQQGIYITSSKIRYEGEFREGKKHGVGVQTWLDGKKYEGEFNENVRYIEGVLTWPDGQKSQGLFFLHNTKWGRKIWKARDGSIVDLQ